MGFSLRLPGKSYHYRPIPVRISVPLFAAACLSVLMTRLSFAQTNVEPASAPSAGVQASAPDAATPKPAPEVNHKKVAPPGKLPGNVFIDPSGIHVGDGRGVDIAMVHGPDAQIGWFSGIITLVAIASPFLTLVAIFAIVLHFRHRRRVVVHETLRAMIEKGLPIPPELLSGGADGDGVARPRSAHRDLRGGLVLVGLGAALFFLSGKWGAIPLVIGAALLIVWGFERWEMSKRATNP